MANTDHGNDLSVLSRNQQIAGINVDNGPYSYAWGVYGGMEWLVHPFQLDVLIRCGGPVAGSTNRRKAKGIITQSKYPVWQTIKVEDNEEYPIEVVAWCGTPHIPFTTQNQRPHTSCAAGRFAAATRNMVAIFSPISSSPSFENYQTVTWKAVRVLRDERLGNIRAFSWSPDGRFFLVGSSTISLWGIQTQRDGQPNWNLIGEKWKLNQRLPKNAPGSDSDTRNQISLVEFSPDGRLFVSVDCYSPMVKVWYHDPSGVFDQFSYNILGHPQAVMDVQWRPRVGPLRTHRRQGNKQTRVPSPQTLLTITRDGIVRLYQETSHDEPFNMVLQATLSPRINDFERESSSIIRGASWAIPLPCYDGLQWTDDTATYPHVHLSDAFSKWGEMSGGHGHYSGVDVNQEPELRIGTIPLINTFRDWLVAVTDQGQIILWEVQGTSQSPRFGLRVVARSLCETVPERVGARRHLDFITDLEDHSLMIPRKSWCRPRITYPYAEHIDVQMGFTTHGMKLSPSDVEPDVLDVLFPGRYVGALWMAHCNLSEHQSTATVGSNNLKSYKGYVDSVFAAIIGHSAVITGVSSTDSVTNVWEADHDVVPTNESKSDSPMLKRHSSLASFKASTFDPSPVLTTVCEDNRILLWKIHDHIALGPLQLDGIVPPMEWKSDHENVKVIHASGILFNDLPITLVAFSNGAVVANYRTSQSSTNEHHAGALENLDVPDSRKLNWEQVVLLKPGNIGNRSGASGIAVAANLEAFSLSQRQFFVTCVGMNGMSITVLLVSIQSTPNGLSMSRDTFQISIHCRELWHIGLQVPEKQIVAFSEPRGCSVIRPETVCMVSASPDGIIRIWGGGGPSEKTFEQQTSSELSELYQFSATSSPHDGLLCAITTSWSGRIATLSEAGTVCVWEPETNTPFFTLEKKVIDPRTRQRGESHPVQIKLSSFGARCEILVVTSIRCENTGGTGDSTGILDSSSNGVVALRNGVSVASKTNGIVSQHVDLFALENENVLTVSGTWALLCQGPRVRVLNPPRCGSRNLSLTRAGGLITTNAGALHVHGGWTHHPIEGSLSEELQYMRKRRLAFSQRKGKDFLRLPLRDVETQLEAMSCIGAMAATRQRSLPDYHPHMLSECLYAGLVEPARKLLSHLYIHVKQHVEGLRELYGDDFSEIRDRSLLKVHLPPSRLSELLTKQPTKPIVLPTEVVEVQTNQASGLFDDWALGGNPATESVHEPVAASGGGGRAEDLFSDFAMDPSPTATITQPTRSAAADLFGYSSSSDNESVKDETKNPEAPIDTEKDELEDGEIDFSELSELLPMVVLDDLSPSENLKLLAVVSVFQALHGSSSKENSGAEASALDEFGTQFLLVFRKFEIDRRLVSRIQRPTCLSTVDACWALHSDSQDALLDLLLSGTEIAYTWSVARSHCAGLWNTSPNVARKLAETIAQAEYRESETKDPFSCALFYFAMGKKQVVTGLFRLAKNAKVTELLSNDFTESRWKKAAVKNAFALLQKQRYWEAIGFFLLAGSYRDAISVCIKNLGDIQLALFLSLLVGFQFPEIGQELRQRIVRDTLLPLAEYIQDRWLASLALTLLGEHVPSVTVFSEWPDLAALTHKVTEGGNMDSVFDKLLQCGEPVIVSSFDSSEPYFVKLLLQDKTVCGSGKPGTNQALSRTLAASLLRACCFLMNSGLPLLAMKPLRDVWELGILSQLPTEIQPTEKWRDSLMRDLASESLLPILLDVRSKLLIATGIAKTGQIQLPAQHHLDRLKADFETIDEFCNLSRSTQVAKGLSHLCIRSNFHAVHLIMLHPLIRESIEPFRAHLSWIVCNLATVGYSAAINPLNDGRDGGLVPSRRCAAMVVVVLDSLVVLTDTNVGAVHKESEVLSKELWVATVATCYFALFSVAIHMDQMGLVQAMVEHELNDTYDSDPNSAIPLAFREAAEKLSFDWYDHEEVLIQRSFDDDESIIGPEGDEVSMAIWAEVYCRRLLRLLLVRFMLDKLQTFGLTCLGREFSLLDPCPQHKQQFEGCTVFETLFESISWWCDSLLASLQSCRPPNRMSRGSLSLVDIKNIEGAKYISGQSNGKLQVPESPRRTISMTIGGCAMLQPLAKLVHDSFENNDEQYLWQHMKGRGYLRLLFAEVALRDQVMVQQQPDVVPRYSVEDSTEIFRKPGLLVLACSLVNAKPDVIQMASDTGIREINVGSSIRFRQRTPSRRSLLDNESTSWEESLNRFERFEVLHQEQGIQFYDGMSALGTSDLARLLRGGAPLENAERSSAKLRANEGIEQGEIAWAHEQWRAHEPWQLGPRGASSFNASYGIDQSTRLSQHYLDLYQKQTKRSVEQLSRRRVKSTIASHNSPVTKLAPHPFLPHYCAGTLDGSVVLWEVGCKDALAKYVKKKESGWVPAFVTRVRTSADGEKVMASDNAGQLAIWKIHDSRGEMLPHIGLKSNSKRTMDCEFLNAGTVVATAGQSTTHRNLCIWDTLLPPRVCRVASVCCGQANGLYSMSYSNRYQQIVVGDGQGQLLSYDLRQRKISDVVQAAHAKSVMTLAWDTSGSYFASGSTDGSIKLWSLASARMREIGALQNIHPVHTFMNHSTSESIISQRGTTDLFFTDRSLVSCGADGTVKLTAKKNFFVLD